MEEIDEIPFLEISGREELEKARYEAENEAFQFVSHKISTSSNLESLEQIKQTVLSKHQNKIAFLKARVQGIVTNIENGINDLEQTAKNLQSLSSEIKSIEEESDVAVIEKFNLLQGLAKIYERATIIDELMSSFQDTDEEIESITKYFDENPESFSIKIFVFIESLINFESELLSNIDEQNQRYVRDHFEPIHKCREKLINNVYNCLENAFSQNVDCLVRANWIMIAIDERNKIIEFLRSAITRQTYSKMQDIDRNNVSLYLKKLSDMIETLPEQLELLIPALPSDINALELTTSFANTEIYKMLINYKDSMPMNASLVDSMVKCMKDIECTLRALLCVSPSEDFYTLMMELQQSFENILYDDYRKFLDNIINLDIESVNQRRDGIYYTPGPKDLIDRLQDAYAFAKSSASNIAPVARAKLVDQLAESFFKLGSSACDSYDMKYIIAVVNNSVDAVKLIADFAKSNPEILEKEDIKKLQKPWSETKNRGLNVLSQIAFSRVIANDSDFRFDFHDKIDSINENLTELSKHLYQPLYKKLLSLFSRELIPHYIQSFFYKEFEKPKTQEELESLITQECNALSAMFTNLEQSLCRTSIEVIEAFRDFIIEPYESLHDIFHIVAKEYNDFTPAIAMALLKMRPDQKEAKNEFNECWGAFEAMYENVEKTRGDHFFNQENGAKKGILK